MTPDSQDQEVGTNPDQSLVTLTADSSLSDALNHAAYLAQVLQQPLDSYMMRELNTLR